MIGRIATLALSLMVIIFCCFATELVPAYVEKTPVEVIDRYSLGKPTGSGLILYGPAYKCQDDPRATCYPTVVDQSVARIGWNDDFILVERHPRDTYIFATPDPTIASWYIINLSSGTVYKDLSSEEFSELIEKLEIPAIELHDPVAIYEKG
jgi:hypothetical protein